MRSLIKQNQGKLNAVHVTMDIIISMSSSCLSYLFYSAITQKDLVYQYISDFGKDFIFLSVIALIQIFFNYAFDLYRSYRSTRFRKETVNVLKSNLFFCIIQIAAVLFTQTLPVFQVMILGYYIIDTFTAVVYRAFLRSVLKYMRSHGYNKKYIAIIGVNNCTERFIEKIQTSSNLGFELSGYFASAPDNKIKAAYLGNYKKISEFYRHSPPDEAVIMLSDQLQPSLDHLIAICENWGIKFSILPNMFSSFSSRIYISSFDGIPLLSMRKVPLESTFNRFLKRLMDIVGSIFLIILFSPVMLVTAIAIKATSEGNIIFKQERVGLSNKPFTMYKFRSMRVETENDIAMTERNDERCTKVGLFIRKYSIDELPQFFNVLKGDMSLVGPRPEIPYYVEQFRKSIPLYMVKHYVKPGITGWAQVNDLRGGDTSIEERIKHDIYYIENWSVGFDIKILFKTLSKIVFSKNAR